jgi:hypothetical protein
MTMKVNLSMCGPCALLDHWESSKAQREGRKWRRFVALLISTDLGLQRANAVGEMRKKRRGGSSNLVVINPSVILHIQRELI